MTHYLSNGTRKGKNVVMMKLPGRVALCFTLLPGELYLQYFAPLAGGVGEGEVVEVDVSSQGLWLEGPLGADLWLSVQILKHLTSRPHRVQHVAKDVNQSLERADVLYRCIIVTQ